jgi:hypothetical protein
MVISSMLTHFLTVHKLPAWAIKEVDRFRRSFLWKGVDHDKVRGGHCLVKWKCCTRPRRLGGLGIKDLDKFGRALRLRWLWHNWDIVDQPWKNLLKLQDKTDRAFFFASSVMRVGDGRNTPFWESRWLNGVSPKELAPNLFNQARFKQRTVHKELQQFNWITNIQSIGTEDLLDEFILLFTLLSEVQLSEEKDTIIWKWTVTGEYSTSSTHEVQFLGAYPLFRASTIWQAKTEDKYRFFA